MDSDRVSKNFEASPLQLCVYTSIYVYRHARLATEGEFPGGSESWPFDSIAAMEG